MSSRPPAGRGTRSRAPPGSTSCSHRSRPTDGRSRTWRLARNPADERGRKQPATAGKRSWRAPAVVSGWSAPGVFGRERQPLLPAAGAAVRDHGCLDGERQRNRSAEGSGRCGASRLVGGRPPGCSFGTSSSAKRGDVVDSLKLASRDGSDVQTLSEAQAIDGVRSVPAWSPNGKWIAFNTFNMYERYHRLFVIRPDGSHRHQIAVRHVPGLVAEREADRLRARSGVWVVPLTGNMRVASLPPATVRPGPQEASGRLPHESRRDRVAARDRPA